VFNLQGSEIVVILILALVVLGPEKLPNAIRQFTRTYAELKKMSTGFQSELKSALDEPMREMRETANMVRDAADPQKILDEAEAEQRLEHTRVMDEASPITTPVASTPWDSVPSTPSVPGLPPPSLTAQASAPPTPTRPTTTPPPPAPPPASANPDRSARPNPVGPNPDQGPAT